jgi:hypothetical protein
MEKIKLYEDFLSEKIKASEAYDTMEGVQTLVDGKRDLAFISIMDNPIYTPNNIDELKALAYGASQGLRVMEIPGKEDGQAYIMYREGAKDKAQKLSDYTSKKGGYLVDDTPEEARFVGNLLDYEEADIEEYIERNYGRDK